MQIAYIHIARRQYEVITHLDSSLLFAADSLADCQQWLVEHGWMPRRVGRGYWR